jgi:16S rRNA (guanine527-N7)-methyltransferase
MTSDIVFKYFPDLTAQQRAQIKQLPELYNLWNSQINVISRKDIDFCMSVMCCIPWVLPK